MGKRSNSVSPSEANEGKLRGVQPARKKKKLSGLLGKEELAFQKTRRKYYFEYGIAPGSDFHSTSPAKSKNKKPSNKHKISAPVHMGPPGAAKRISAKPKSIPDTRTYHDRSLGKTFTVRESSKYKRTNFKDSTNADGAETA